MPNSIITRRASLSTAPSTWNAEARTIEVTFSTFADVQRAGYVERVTPEGLDLSRLIGAHVLKDHNASSIDNVRRCEGPRWVSARATAAPRNAAASWNIVARPVSSAATTAASIARNGSRSAAANR